MREEFAGQAIACMDTPKSNRNPTAREQLIRRRADLEEQLKDVTEAISALDSNPEIERVLTLVGRTVRF